MTLFLNTHHSQAALGPAKEALAHLPKEKPIFATHKPPLEQFYQVAGKYSHVRNFIIVGRGGAIANFQAVFQALGAHLTTKRLYYLNTNDPVAISIIKKRCLPSDTLVVVISRSGKTIDVIENTLVLEGYQKLVITGKSPSPLKQLQEIRELEFVEHPPIPGRFSAITASTLLPASLLYIDIKPLVDGMRASYERYDPEKPIGENQALELATALFTLESGGFSEIMVPLYGARIEGFSQLITQLMHESACKGGKGQTVLARSARKLHADQRIFGGKKNIILVPHHIKQIDQEIRLSVPMEYREMMIGKQKLVAFDGESLNKAFQAKYNALCDRTIGAGIPLCSVTIENANPYTIGELIGFWQYVAYYSALLRGLDPMTSPATTLLKEQELAERVQ